ncbi:hypothetical protein [Burkholderia sp. MSMB1826]|uniref:hypothetical protein n=1 Tax=Burkholderia sp. MSMB1826 TaxID=1637875 RepID=UPI00076CE3EB|nr:hypothetical protein [Burkholderia sp. MSMB1826]KVL21548.1 hypothetical protein WS95_11330 [Burkholderia sp. MSMB1826]
MEVRAEILIEIAMNDTRWKWVFRMRKWIAVSCSALVSMGPIHADASGDRCGWLDLSQSTVKRDAIEFHDSERIWLVNRDAGQWPLIRQSDMYPNRAASYAHSDVREEDQLTCACMAFESVDGGVVSKMRRARLIPIERCLNDRNLWQPPA